MEVKSSTAEHQNPVARIRRKSVSWDELSENNLRMMSEHEKNGNGSQIRTSVVDLVTPDSSGCTSSAVTSTPGSEFEASLAFRSALADGVLIVPAAAKEQGALKDTNAQGPISKPASSKVPTREHRTAPATTTAKSGSAQSNSILPAKRPHPHDTTKSKPEGCTNTSNSKSASSGQANVRRLRRKPPAVNTSRSDETTDSARSTPSPPTPTVFFSHRDFRRWQVGTRYRLTRVLGHGSYGEVAEAVDLIKNKRVAIKKVENIFEQEVDAKRIYREIHILRRLKHDNIISLIDIIIPTSFETFTTLYLVFEFVDTDLYKLILSPQYLTIPHIQTFLYQMLCGLKHTHSANVIHRDMKPANILLNEDCTLKICDFGLARVLESREHRNHIDLSIVEESAKLATPSPDQASPSRPRLKRQLTKHVVTRWYRAPELILLQEYDTSVDLWSLGCIFAELLSMQPESVSNYQKRTPLFPGKSCFPLSAERPTTYSDKLDQLNVIFDVIGTPTEEDIKELGEVSQYLRRLPKKEPKDFQTMYPGAPPDAIDLLRRLLAFNPDNRISIDDAINHSFLQPIRRRDAEVDCASQITMDIEDAQLKKEELKELVYKEILCFNEERLSELDPGLLSGLEATTPKRTSRNS